MFNSNSGSILHMNVEDFLCHQNILWDVEGFPHMTITGYNSSQFFNFSFFSLSPFEIQEK